MQWCEHHRDDPFTDNDMDDRHSSEIEEWDKRFMQVDQEMLFEIILVMISEVIDLWTFS